MALETKIQTLAICTERLGVPEDPFDTIDEGLLLLQTVSTDNTLAEKLVEKLTGFGEALLNAKAAYIELADLIKTESNNRYENLNNLKLSIEEWQTQTVLGELRKYCDVWELIDRKLQAAEESFNRLETFNEMLEKDCRRYQRAKTTAGGMLMASGCMALALSAAALLIKFTVQRTGQSLGPATSVLLRISPLNTALTGSVVVVLGARDTRKSLNYTKLSLDLSAFTDDIQRLITSWRSFRTNVQRLLHALKDVIIGLKVGSGLGSINGSIWGAFLSWIPIQETSLALLNPPNTDNDNNTTATNDFVASP